MRILSAIMLACLAGCGVESVGTAATGAAIKQQELQQGKKTMDEAQKKIGAAMEQVQSRSPSGDEK
jgi:hypothetical protein